MSDTPEFGSRCERLGLGDGEHKQEALPAPEVVVSDGCVVLLPRRVQDVYLHFFPIEDHFLPVTVGLGRFVVLHELSKQTTRSAVNKVLRRKAAKKINFNIWALCLLST